MNKLQYQFDICYATSADGWTWREEGLAVPRGEKGNYDDHPVFTVEIMKWKANSYLSYQAVKSPCNRREKILLVHGQIRQMNLGIKVNYLGAGP